jgi:hypothetical protein
MTGSEGICNAGHRISTPENANLSALYRAMDVDETETPLAPRLETLIDDAEGGRSTAGQSKIPMIVRFIVGS